MTYAPYFYIILCEKAAIADNGSILLGMTTQVRGSEMGTGKSREDTRLFRRESRRKNVGPRGLQDRDRLNRPRDVREIEDDESDVEHAFDTDLRLIMCHSTHSL